MHRQPPKPQASGFLKQIRPGRNHQHRNLRPFPHSLAPNRSLPTRERQPVLPLTRRSTWSLEPEFVERAAPADRQRVLTLVPVVVRLNGRVPEVSPADLRHRAASRLLLPQNQTPAITLPIDMVGVGIAALRPA